MQQDNIKCGKSGFNYCKWAKALIAVPLFPMIAYIAAMQFNNLAIQFIAAFLSVFVLIKLAIWVDTIPALQKKIRDCSCQ